MSLFKNDSDIYEEMEGKRSSHTFQRVVAIGVFVALGFAVGNFYASVNKDEVTANEPIPVVTTSSVSNSSALSIADIAEMTADSVVEISTSVQATSYFYGNYTATGNGSGVIISSDGYIVTNNHVTSGANKVTVTLRNGKEYEATLIGNDAKTDIAILKIDATGLTAAKLGDSASLRVGETAVVIGNPLGKLGGTVTNGIISALEREITLDGKAMNLIQTNAAINPGNSGGGLFNDKGELVGIVVAKSSGLDVEGLGFAIPVNDVKSVINDIIDLGYVSNRPFLGVEFASSNTSSYQSNYGFFFGFGGQMMYQYGAEVGNVVEGSAAEKAGIQARDHIISIDNVAVSSGSDVSSIVSEHQIGDTIEIGIIRDNKTMTVKATLGEYKGE
ncbi:MAG: trypsin-like peptidase domain-containing protein [Clostridia bacterium]|nr:trypsin-like peptidase domain-containing protein [Clostridia bacterium]